MPLTNPRYANHENGVLIDDDNGVANYLDANEPDPVRLELYNDIIAGRYGDVVAYVEPVLPPPSAEQLRVTAPNLSMRQFRLQLLEEGLLSQVDAAIAAMPSPQKETAQINWEYATQVVRTDDLVATLMPALGLTDEQVDTMWDKALLK